MTEQQLSNVLPEINVTDMNEMLTERDYGMKQRDKMIKDRDLIIRQQESEIMGLRAAVNQLQQQLEEVAGKEAIESQQIEVAAQELVGDLDSAVAEALGEVQIEVEENNILEIPRNEKREEPDKPVTKGRSRRARGGK